MVTPNFLISFEPTVTILVSKIKNPKMQLVAKNLKILFYFRLNTQIKLLKFSIFVGYKINHFYKLWKNTWRF